MTVQKCKISISPARHRSIPKICTSGEMFSHSWDRHIRQMCISANFDVRRMLSHPGGWDKPIPEVVPLWRHRTSTPNNLEKSRLVCVLDIFCSFLDKNEKNNQTPHWGRDEGIPSSCPRFATSTTRQASSWIANLGHSDGIPSSLPQCGVRFY